MWSVDLTPPKVCYDICSHRVLAHFKLVIDSMETLCLGDVITTKLRSHSQVLCKQSGHKKVPIKDVTDHA